LPLPEIPVKMIAWLVFLMCRKWRKIACVSERPVQ